MRSVRFWRMHIKQFSLIEKMFFKDMIKTLLSWEILKDEVIELDLILRLLESEIKLTEINTSGNKTDKKVRGLHEGIRSHNMCESIKILTGQ